MGRRRRNLLRCSPTLACLLAVLSVSLFTWGLAYKLSLYRSHQLPPKMAAAKLLSQKERPATAQAHQFLPRIMPHSAWNAARLPSLYLSSFTHVARLQIRSQHFADARESFTVHTDRKPPPSVIS